MEAFTITVGIIIGAVIGAFILYIIIGRSKDYSVERTKERNSDIFESKRIVTGNEIERARKDLNAILLEKDLIGSALTRVYEAEVDGRINRQEREELSERYKNRLKEVEENLGDIEITIEVGELERLREELVNLFERKLQQIDSRLQDARIKLDKIKPHIKLIEKPEIVEKKPKQKKAKYRTEESEVDVKVKALREEVLEALARLEQMDIEG
jgi:hypothetical protein